MKTTRLLMVGGAVILGLSFVFLAGGFRTRSGAEKDPEPKINGRELFTREWLPGDSRSHGGDGLGPVFNARSCVACHHQGGVGGAGPGHMNVTVVSAFVEQQQLKLPAFFLFSRIPNRQQPDRSKLAEIHPALRTENSFPLPRFGTDKEFAKWKIELLGLRGGGALGPHSDTKEPDPDEVDLEGRGVAFGFSDGRTFPSFRKVGGSAIHLVASERNAPSLFGQGLIDRISDDILEEVALSQARAVKKAMSSEELSALVELIFPDNFPRRYRDG